MFTETTTLHRLEYRPPREASIPIHVTQIPRKCITHIEADNDTKFFLDSNFKHLASKDHIRESGLFTAPHLPNAPSISTDSYAGRRISFLYKPFQCGNLLFSSESLKGCGPSGTLAVRSKDALALSHELNYFAGLETTFDDDGANMVSKELFLKKGRTSLRTGRIILDMKYTREYFIDAYYGIPNMSDMYDQIFDTAQKNGYTFTVSSHIGGFPSRVDTIDTQFTVQARLPETHQREIKSGVQLLCNEIQQNLQMRDTLDELAPSSINQILLLPNQLDQRFGISRVAFAAYQTLMTANSAQTIHALRLVQNDSKSKVCIEGGNILACPRDTDRSFFIYDTDGAWKSKRSKKTPIQKVLFPTIRNFINSITIQQDYLNSQLVNPLSVENQMLGYVDKLAQSSSVALGEIGW